MNKNFFALRLNQALADADMKAAELCRLCDIRKSTMSQYLSGKYTAKYDRIMIMSRILGCNPDWLAGKDVPMTSSLADGGTLGMIPVLLPDGANLLSPELTTDYEPAEDRYCDGYHYYFIAEDDSMDPLILEGDRVLCQHRTALSDGQTGVFILPDGKAVIRELRCSPSGNKLVCANRYFPPYVIDKTDSVHIIGKVIRSTRYW